MVLEVSVCVCAVLMMVLMLDHVSGSLTQDVVAGQVPQEGFVHMAHLSRVLSVPVPFRGDYVGLQGNPKLQRLKGREEGPVLVADAVKKVNRGNGKVRSYSRPRRAFCLCFARGLGWATCLSSLSVSSLDFFTDSPPDQGACDSHRCQEVPGPNCH